MCRSTPSRNATHPAASLSHQALSRNIWILTCANWHKHQLLFLRSDQWTDPGKAVEEKICHEFLSAQLNLVVTSGGVPSGIFSQSDQSHGLPIPVDNDGRLTEEITDFAGMYVKEADKEIVAKIKAMGRLVDNSSLMHTYPFCWRSETPLIYRVGV